MSLLNNRNILIGSASQSLDRRIILGDTFNKESLKLLLLLVKYAEFCQKQHQAGVEGYSAKVEYLEKKISKLMYMCPEICIYRDRVFLASNNQPPTLQDNILEIPLILDWVPLPFSQVVYRFQDPDNDYIGNVVFTSQDEDVDLKVNSNPLMLNSEYRPVFNMESLLEEPEGIKYLFKNTGAGYTFTESPYLSFDGETIYFDGEAVEAAFDLTASEENVYEGLESCVAEIIAVDEAEYEAAKAQGEVINIHSDLSETTIFQIFSEATGEIPNDTIIYAHIDRTSMGVTDQETIRDSILAWYANFKIENPTFAGSLVINTVDNSVINDGFAVGRGGKEFTSILEDSGMLYHNLYSDYAADTTKNGDESWLQNPMEGLLRHAWKFGESDFATESDFFTYIEGKNLITLSFVDESQIAYHDTGSAIDDHTPTFSYINDYNNFINNVRSRLGIFKGVLYPVTNPINSTTMAFLGHALGAMEGDTRSESEINQILTAEKVAELPRYYLDLIYEFMLANPYGEDLNGLKDAGWRGEFTKVSSGTGDNFDPVEFAAELDGLLSVDETIVTQSFSTLEIDSENLGLYIDTPITLKAQDNHPLKPLYSNVATTTLRHLGVCEDIIEDPFTNIIYLGTTDTSYTLQVADFQTLEYGTIKITAVDSTFGSLTYKGYSIKSTDLPVIISAEGVAAGYLKYTPASAGVDYIINITYGLTLPGKLNYNSNNILTVAKENIQVEYAIVAITGTSFDFPFGADTGTGTITSRVTYSGDGSYEVVWTQLTGPNTSVLETPNSETLDVSNLISGTYTYQIAVTTSEGLITTETATLAVSQLSQVLLFGGSEIVLDNTSTDLEVSAVLAALQQQIPFTPGILTVDCDTYNDYDPGVDYYTYIAIKPADGTITSIKQSNIDFEMYGAFAELGTFTHDGESWFVLRTNYPGAFSEDLQLYIKID